MIVQVSMIVSEMAHAWNLIFVHAMWALKERCVWTFRVKHEVVVQVSVCDCAKRFLNIEIMHMIVVDERVTSYL